MTINSIITYPTDLAIRKGIAEIINEALKNKYGGTNPAIVYDRWVINSKTGETTARLRPMTGTSTGNVHCWMIGLDSIKRSLPEYGTEGAGRTRKVGANRRDIFKTYRVWCFHKFNVGTSESNSENILAEEIEHVSNFFSKYPLLNFTEDNKKIQGHLELEFPNIDTFQAGNDEVNVAQGTLTIKLYQSVE